MSAKATEIEKPSSAASSDSDYAIELRGISKSFGAVQANKNIDLKVKRGTIHGIVGENGAGKSTLMSILYGFYKADRGDVFIQGKRANITGPQDAIDLGIGMVFQHFMLVEPFSVLENIILGAEKSWRLRNTKQDARTRIETLAREYEMEVDPDSIVGDLSVGLQQRVEILKALYREADVLILDEPTGVLTPAEADHLFRILDSLRAEGKTIIIITHKLREIMAITDTVSVMRRGEMTGTVATSTTNVDELAKMMVGRDVDLRVDKTPAKVGEEILSVDKLNYVNSQGVKKLKDVSFSVKRGEILGIAGVAGNGQSELLEILAGMRPAKSGAVNYKNEPLLLTNKASPSNRREMGIAHIPEDRHRRGLVKPFRVWENTAFGYHNDDKYSGKFGAANQKFMRDDAADKMARFDIRPPNIELLAQNFSGGNQQKIVVAREIDADPDLLLIGQPTRGVDIGAIEFIHKEIIRMRDAGKAVILVSVELDEILALSDRILVLFDGAISGEKMAAETNDQELGLLMAGVM